MTPADESECRRVVLGYATALNEWEVLSYIFDRVQTGRHVSPSRAELVTGLTQEILTGRHVEMFDMYIYPKDRKYGTTPGAPTMFGRDGRLSNVSEETIAKVAERNRTTIEVITEWGYILPGGRTMFVLKRQADRWLIDSLKTEQHGGGWTSALI